jgi:hypothetical protein
MIRQQAACTKQRTVKHTSSLPAVGCVLPALQNRKTSSCDKKRLRERLMQLLLIFPTG